MQELQYIKLHFAWIDYGIDERIKLREQLLNSNEEQRLESIKHHSFKNAFLIKRLRNFTFSNRIYYAILKNPEIQKKILPKLFEIISKRTMYDAELKESISKGGLKLYPFSDMDSIEEQYEQKRLTNEDSITYLKNKVDYLTEEGNIDALLATRSMLAEYTTGLVSLGDLFTKRLHAKQALHPLHYDDFSARFAIDEINNFTIYQIPNDPNLTYLSQNLRQSIGQFLKSKFVKFAFELLDVEKNIHNIIQYNPLFNHVLSIASDMYFSQLTLEEKENLINSKETIDDFISIINKIGIINEYDIWIECVTYFNKTGAPEYGLKVMNILQEKWFSQIKNEDKYNFFDTIATIERNLGNYEEALNIYLKGLKWVSISAPYSIRMPNSLTSLLNYEPVIGTLQYRESVCRKNIAECYYNLGKKDKYKEEIANVNELIKRLNTKPELFSIYYNLAVSHRRLYNYEKERFYLNKALDYIDYTISSELYEEIDSRLELFQTTEMNFEKIKSYDIKRKILRKEFIAKQLQNSFFFEDSIFFYKQALEINRKTGINYDVNNILLELGFSNLYALNWSDALEYFKQSLQLDENELIKQYLAICYSKLDDIPNETEILNEIKTIFSLPPDIITQNNKTWILDILNFLTREQIINFIRILDRYESDLLKYNCFTSIALVASNFGFNELGIYLFKKAINFAPNDEFLASIYNNLGTVFIQLDEYEKGIEYFNRGIEVYRDCFLCYRHLANAYTHKLEFQNACDNQEKALEILKRQSASEEMTSYYEQELEFYKSLIENVINIDKVDIEDVKGFLITAENFYLDYQGKKPPFDASPIITGFSKALERILHDKISSKFHELLLKYKKKYNNHETSEDFHKKFGNLFRNKTIGLGSWERIIVDFGSGNIDIDLIEFKELIFKSYSENDRTEILSACRDISTERNPLSHYKFLSMTEVIEIRKTMITHLNKIIDIVFN